MMSANVSQARPQCVVFHSQHKAGGSTVEAAFQRTPVTWFNISSSEWQRRANCCLYGPKKHDGTGLWWICDVFDFDLHQMRCSQIPHHRMGYPERTTPRLMTMSYVLSLAKEAAWSRSACRWVTVFREPISRLISAHRYCQKNYVDHVCGTRSLNASNASVLQWAHHWGNPLFRELLMHPAVVHTSVLRTKTHRLPRHRTPTLEVWEEWKRVLGDTEDVRLATGEANLKSVITLLEGNGGPVGGVYDAIGKLDEWNASCAIFDALVPLRGISWIAATTGQNLKNSNAQSIDSLQLQKGRDDPDIRGALSADLHLYHKVFVPAFEMQKQHYSVSLT